MNEWMDEQKFFLSKNIKFIEIHQTVNAALGHLQDGGRKNSESTFIGWAYT